jgi:hypothetical protein
MNPRILIAFLVCHRYVPMMGSGWDWTNREKHRSNVDSQIFTCRETWVKDLAAYPNVDYKFFYGRGANRQPLPDEVFLNVGDDYRSLPYKTNGMCLWAGERGYDFIFKTDDDTFVWVDNLMSSGFENYDYVGSVNDMIPSKSYATGLGYWLSARAVRLVAAARPNSGLEDHWVGDVLRSARITPKHDGRYISISSKFVGVEKMPRNSEFIAVHPCSPQMMYTYAAEAKTQ